MFERMTKEKKTSFVAKQILEAIERGELRTGDKLPSEMSIIEQTGVSRTAVREALSALELMDVIERRAGDGTYVKEKNLLGQQSETVEVNNELLQMLEEIEGNNGSFQAFFARIMLEPVIAEVAVRRADDEALRRVRGIYESLRKSAEERDIKNYHSYDNDFHVALAEATNNEVMVRFLRELLSLMKIQYWRSDHVWPEEKMKRSLEDHLAIVESLEQRDADAVKKKLQAHFTTSLKIRIHNMQTMGAVNND
ncbi:MAG: FadR family transcriptional regulator [Synergistales bacterium]|nr:FadR family transcriptional regulator [Synergistales bacterium]